MRILSYILTTLGVLFGIGFAAGIYSFFSFSDPEFLYGNIFLVVFYGIPMLVLLLSGYFIRRRLASKNSAKSQPVPQFNPVYVNPPVQQQSETKTVIKVVHQATAPIPKKTVSVECKGCGARQAVAQGESPACEYCGSPLTANAY